MLVYELCVESRDEEWREYLSRMLVEIQEKWTPEDWERHSLIHNPQFALIEFNMRPSRRDLRKRGE